MLRAVFPDVSKISEKVLTVFHQLDFLLEVREVEHFVKFFNNIQYGEVLWKNVPFEWLKNHFDKIEKEIDGGDTYKKKDQYEDLVSKKEGEKVEIVS